MYSYNRVPHWQGYLNHLKMILLPPALWPIRPLAQWCLISNVPSQGIILLA